MNTFQSKFNRIEKKYLITREEMEKLILGAGSRLEYDERRKYKICNIYFDTEDYASIRESLEKPLYKEKLRLRSYGVPTDDSDVFLEIKKKFKGRVYKRRIKLKNKEAMAYVRDGKAPENDSQIFREIDWLRRSKGLEPAVYLSYERTAMQGADEPDLRVTFDSEIVWRTDKLDLSEGSFGNIHLRDDMYIMEIKADGGMPLWLASLLSELKLYTKSYSKYGEVFKLNLI